MDNMKKLFSIFLLAASIAAVAPVKADWDPLGLRKAASEAGAEAAAKLLEASRNVPLTTNQFGLLIDEYYSSDPAKRDKAHRIINGVFPDLAQDKNSSP